MTNILLLAIGRRLKGGEKREPVDGVIGIPQRRNRLVQILGRVEIADGADV